jgi:hypothetical protein
LVLEGATPRRLAIEAQTGFGTLRACIYDASRQGFTNTDDAVYDLSNTRWI